MIRRSMSARVFFVATVMAAFAIAASAVRAEDCRIDWNGDGQISEEDYLVGDPMGGYYAEWYICVYYPTYYPVLFPMYGLCTDRLDYNGDGVLDQDDLMGPLDATQQSEGFYVEWYIYMFYPAYYPIFMPEYTCPPQQYCDVVYQLAAEFRVSDAPNSCGDLAHTIGTNSTDPPLSGGETTPFDTSSVFSTAFMRLRFQESGGDPVAGPVELIEYYLPIEFNVGGCPLTSVITDVDHSLGILGLNSAIPPVLETPVTLDRPCTTWATGSLSGTTLDWSNCDVQYTGTGGDWSHDDAQAGPEDVTEACAMRMTGWGAVTCSGVLCGLVPGLGNQLNTWDQLLNNFDYTATDLRTATFDMNEVEVPESTSETNTRTWLTFTSATPIHVECGNLATLTCDEVAP